MLNYLQTFAQPSGIKLDVFCVEEDEAMCVGRSLSISSSLIKCKGRKILFMIVIKLVFGRRVVVHNHKWYHMISSGESI